MAFCTLALGRFYMYFGCSSWICQRAALRASRSKPRCCAHWQNACSSRTAPAGSKRGATRTWVIIYWVMEMYTNTLKYKIWYQKLLSMKLLILFNCCSKIFLILNAVISANPSLRVFFKIGVFAEQSHYYLFLCAELTLKLYPSEK